MRSSACLVVGVSLVLAASACSGSEESTPTPNLGEGGVPPGGPDVVAGCGSAQLFASPEDPSATGPWPVGVKTVSLPLPGGVGSLKVELWYPAELGSEEGAEKAVYDVRQWLPESEKAKVSDEKHGPPQGGGGFRDLPFDAEHGPYPAVVHIHGTAAFRAASASQTVHWASRGFVVAAADHPGMLMGDMLATVAPGQCTPGTIPQELDRDVDTLLAALTAATGDLAFLADHVDMTSIAIVGHSQGAGAAARMSGKPGVKVDMPLATGGAVLPSQTLESSLILAGMSDTVIPYASNQTAYTASPTPKRLVGIENAGHLVMTDLCGLRNPEGKDLVEIGNEVGICGMNLAGFLWDCSAAYVSQDRGAEIVNYATTAVLEESLHCADRSSQLAELRTKYGEVGEFQEAL